MTVPDTLITILVLATGIFSFVIAQEQIPTTDEPIPLVAEGSNIGNFNPIGFETAVAEMERLMPEMCRKNGGPTAYSTFMEGWQDFVNCTKSVNIVQLGADRATALSTGKWDTFFQKYCPKLPALMQCANHMIESMEPCSDSETQEFVETIQNITTAVQEFVCYDDGNHIASFISTGGIQCLSSKREAVELCFNGASGQLVKPRKLSRLDLSLEDCTYIENIRTCTVAEMQKCDDPTPAKALQSAFDSFKRTTSCQSIFSVQASTTD